MPYQIDILTKKQKKQLLALIGLWALTNAIFIVWWLQPGHIVNLWLFLLNTVVVFWTVLLPSYFFFFAVRMKKPNPDIEIPTNWRVAMVVTKAPGEPFELVTKTLKAMLNQKFPHDTWLADENPTKEMLEWTKKHNVKVSTRKGIPEYNRPKWPRREKSKEGNLTYFYDKFGYDNYDIVVQLDADHVPQKNYLENMIKPFVDPKVGYVSAPSICSKNSENSWTARARLYLESSLHGPHQAGQSNGFAPLCFGSHYAVRTKALRKIGGLGPELAEDHSTSLIMNSHGFKGVHAIDALAIGDGPKTFADAMTQEFQWSRSLMNLFLMWTPLYIKTLKKGIKVEFIFAQMWYPLYSIMILAGLLLPVLAIALDSPTVSVSYLSFFAINSVNIAITLCIMFYLKKIKTLRPIDAKIISWEIILFQIARWPWTLFGVTTSLIDFIFKREFAFKVTPKDQIGYTPLPFKSVLPYLGVILLYLLTGVIFKNSYNSAGYYYFLIIGLFMYLLTLGTIIVLHEREQKK